MHIAVSLPVTEQKEKATFVAYLEASEVKFAVFWWVYDVGLTGSASDPCSQYGGSFRAAKNQGGSRRS